MTDLEKILYTLRESRKVIKQNTNINTSIKITLQQIENSIYLVKNLSLSGVVKSLPQDNYCNVCNLPTDGKKCYSKRCLV
mgnify:CR=1 FL=1